MPSRAIKYNQLLLLRWYYSYQSWIEKGLLIGLFDWLPLFLTIIAVQAYQFDITASSISLVSMLNTERCLIFHKV